MPKSSGNLKCDVPGCRDTKTFSPLGLSIHKRFAHGIHGTAHERKTPPGRDFKCDICNLSCSTVQGLGRHKRLAHGIPGASRHRPDAPFPCSACHRRFRNQHGLSLHFTLAHKGQTKLPLSDSNGRPAASASLPSLDEAITALEIKRDALQWVIEDLKRIAQSH